MTPRLLDTLCLLATSETRQSKYWEKRDDSSPQVLREEGPSFSAGAEGLSPVSFAAAERGDSLLLHCLSGGRCASPAVTEAGGFRLAVAHGRASGPLVLVRPRRVALWGCHRARGALVWCAGPVPVDRDDVIPGDDAGGCRPGPQAGRVFSRPRFVARSAGSSVPSRATVILSFSLHIWADASFHGGVSRVRGRADRHPLPVPPRGLSWSS